MSDYKDLLEQERRRHAMPDGSLEGLQRRRDRKRRNGQILAGVVALLIAAAGIGGGVFALRSSTGPSPADRTPTPTPSPAPGGGQAAPSPVSGPIQFIDEQHGWAIAGGDVLATVDGGKHWSPQYTGPLWVDGLAFADLRTGWAVSADGLLKTTDGGAHWERAAERSGATFREVQFLDAQTGWGVRLDLGHEAEPSGIVIKSTDGGETWTDVSTPNEVESVCFADSMNGWAAGGISLLRTTNGGRNWTGGPLAEFPDGEQWTATVRCTSNGKEAFVLLQGGGAAGHVAYVVWQAADDDQGGYSIQFVIQEAGTHPLGAGYGSVYNSEDPYPGPFAAVGPGTAYFLNWCPACPAPSVHITRTGGEPADVVDRISLAIDDQQATPGGISFIDPRHGWVLLQVSGPDGLGLAVLQTTDGGMTWVATCEPNPTSCFNPRT